MEDDELTNMFSMCGCMRTSVNNFKFTNLLANNFQQIILSNPLNNKILFAAVTMGEEDPIMLI